MDAYRAETKSDLAALDAKLTTVERDAADLTRDVADLTRDVADLTRDVAAHRAETKEGFAALDKELEGHADPIHRALESEVKQLKNDVEPLKARPTRTAARTARRR